MIREAFEAIGREYSGERAKNFVSEIVNFHRIQGSPGYRSASEHIYNILKEHGLECEIIKFPAREGAAFWNYGSFQECEIEEAKLFLITEEGGEEKIADYSVNKFSVIQRSAPTPEGGILSELIVLDKGDREEEYDKVDVRGKVVFASGDLNDVYHIAVEEKGAIGIVTDRMREWPPVRRKMDLPDALQYCSFWWQEGKRKCFGFVVSPRTGLRIRELAKKGRLKVKAFVKSRIYDGTFEVVSARILGVEGGEVIVTAHLCHPQPSANDNASGVAAAVESALVLNRLIEKGELKRPRRSIRFLFVPEITGTVAFLDSNMTRLKDFVAGVNLDMVGEDQKACGSILMVDNTPYSLPSFMNPYVEYMFSLIPKSLSSFSERERFPSIRYEFTSFSGGSDHEVLSDPTVGIPTVSFTNWPDRFYHTSEDTLDKVDPSMLWHAGAVSTAIAYTVSNLSREDYSFLAFLIEKYCEKKVRDMVQETVYSAYSVRKEDALRCFGEKACFWKEFRRFWRWWLSSAIRSLERLDGETGLKELEEQFGEIFDRFLDVEEELLFNYLRNSGKNVGVEDFLSRPEGRVKGEAERVVPKRLKPGPIDLKVGVCRLDGELRRKAYDFMKKRGWRTVSTLALFWADGRRSLLEIWRMLEIEYGRVDLENLIEWFQLLEKMKFVVLENV